MNNILYFQHYFIFMFVHIGIFLALSRREQGFDSPWDYQTKPAPSAGFFVREALGESKSLNCWRGPLVLAPPGPPSSAAMRSYPPCAPLRSDGRAAGASPRRRSRRGDAEGFPAAQSAEPPGRRVLFPLREGRKGTPASDRAPWERSARTGFSGAHSFSFFADLR